jgi:hypothetical protein
MEEWTAIRIVPVLFMMENVIPLKLVHIYVNFERLYYIGNQRRGIYMYCRTKIVVCSIIHVSFLCTLL